MGEALTGKPFCLLLFSTFLPRLSAALPQDPAKNGKTAPLDQLRSDKELPRHSLHFEQHKLEHLENKNHRCGNCHTDDSLSYEYYQKREVPFYFAKNATATAPGPAWVPMTALTMEEGSFRPCQRPPLSSIYWRRSASLVPV